MLIWTLGEIEVGQIFGFAGDNGKTNIGLGDLVYIWSRRNRSGLGDEIVYGTAEVVACLGHGNYTGKRIK
jgi:hypothetical protein